MSRFNNPKALPALLSRPSVPATRVTSELQHSFANPGSRAATPPDRAFSIGSEASPNMAQIFCLFVVCVYMLSGCANDIIFHFTRGRAYISAACVVLLPLLFLSTGASLRGLESPTGVWFAAFAAWLAVAAPFSVWRGGSASMLVNYVARAFMVCF